jgi:hypothetical protein
MRGNVEQWVEDCYHDSYRGAPSDRSAWITKIEVAVSFAEVLGTAFRGSSARPTGAGSPPSSGTITSASGSGRRLRCERCLHFAKVPTYETWGANLTASVGFVSTSNSQHAALPPGQRNPMHTPHHGRRSQWIWTCRMLSRDPVDRCQAEPPMLTWTLFIAAAVAAVALTLAIIFAVSPRSF